VFAVDPAYVVVNTSVGEADPLARSLQWSRRVLGLKVLLLLAEHGADQIAARIDHQCAMGKRLRMALLRTGWQVSNDSPFPLVCFSHPALKNDKLRHDEVGEDLRKRSVAWITRIVLANGQQALRACVTNVETNETDIDRLVAGLAEAPAVARTNGLSDNSAPPEGDGSEPPRLSPCLAASPGACRHPSRAPSSSP
jgi:glutamate/tyrosine decarboxylase-like PLP-dependent enzyme